MLDFAKINILNMQQYGDIRTLYTACKHRGFVMISYYDIRASRNAMKSLQNKPLRRRKLDIHYSIPKVNFCIFIFPIEDISSCCVSMICILVILYSILCGLNYLVNFFPCGSFFRTTPLKKMLTRVLLWYLTSILLFRMMNFVRFLVSMEKSKR